MILHRARKKYFCLNYMDEDDLRSLLNLIKSGGLVDGRKWYKIASEIEEALKLLERESTHEV
ncbi:MAG: hypothetical protein IJ064_05695 [Bacteroidaceae bacterium]|nr:hypothetical protein [Bacteroidaceae bacterium]